MPNYVSYVHPVLPDGRLEPCPTFGNYSKPAIAHLPPFVLFGEVPFLGEGDGLQGRRFDVPELEVQDCVGRRAFIFKFDFP